jgi:hypothetical protein
MCFTINNSMNYGNIHDIWAYGYRLPINDAIFMGTMATLLFVALVCIALDL